MQFGRIQRVKTTAETIADALRSAILQGRLHSGQSLRQDELAAEFNVSKIPVREALVQLQAEGLVTLHQNRGAVVSRLSYAEVDEIYTMRSALEPIALRRAIPHMTPADFLNAEHILDHIDHETEGSRWAEWNWQFHETLYVPARMPLIVQTAREMHNNVARFLIFHYLDRTHLEKSQRQHREILARCRAGDAEGAVALLVEHLSDPVDVYAIQAAQEKE